MKGLRIIELKKIVKALEPAHSANYHGGSHHSRTSSHGLIPFAETSMEQLGGSGRMADVVGP